MDQAKFAKDRSEFLGLPRVAAINGGNSGERGQGHGMLMNEAWRRLHILAEQPVARRYTLVVCFGKSDTFEERIES